MSSLKALWTLLLVSVATAAGAQTYYNVNIEAMTGGNVSAVLTAQAGATVTLTVTPDATHYIEATDIEVLPSGNVAEARNRAPGLGLLQEVTAIDITPEGQGTYTFTMPAWNVTISATFHERTDICTAVITLGKDNGGAGTLAPYAIDGKEHKPIVTEVKLGAVTLKDIDMVTAALGSFTIVVDGTVNNKQEYDVFYYMADYASCGTKEVTVKGRGKYMGQSVQTFSINPKSITKDDGEGGKTASDFLTVTPPTGLVYNAQQQNAAFTIIDNDRTDPEDDTKPYTLVQEKDYTLTGNVQVNAGTYEVTVTGIGDYSSGAAVADRQFKTSFTISKLDLSTTTLTLAQTTYEYDGTKKEPMTTVTIPGTTPITLTTSDYKTEYTNNLVVGTATATVKGTEVNTTGTKAMNFTITKHALTITALPQTVIYGTPITLTVDQVASEGLLSILDGGVVVTQAVSGITLTPSTNQATTEGTITPSVAIIDDGYGNDVAGCYDITYVAGALTINPKAYDSGDITITGVDESYVYTGSEISPVLTVKNTEINEEMVLGTDYDVEYAANLNIGTATVTITFKGNYSGTTTRNFDITKRPVTITALAQTVIYGTAITDGVTKAETEGLATDHTLTAVTLTPSTDQFTTNGTITPSAAIISDAQSTDVTANYEITYTNGLLTINGKDYGSGDIDITGVDESYVYTGSEISPVLTVKNTEINEEMVLGTDYDVEYAGNLNVGTATVTITFKGNYSSTTTRNFTITKRPVTITALAQTVIYGTAITDGVTKAMAEGLVTGHTLTAVTLTPSTDQFTTNGTITPSAAVISDAQGTAVTANYEITYQTGKLTILQKASENLSVDAISSSVYTGQDIKPTPVVKDLDKVLTEGTDYNVSYESNLNVGTATVIITFKGNYSGALTPTFRITKRPVTITAQPQTVTYGTAIDQGLEKAETEGLATGHTLTAVTLTPSTDQQTTEGTITASAAVISNAQGTAVTTNYEITYQTGKLTILQKASENLSVDAISNSVYTGQDIKPVPVVKDLGKVLTEGTDYSVSYENNLNAGTATVIITFKGNYSGTLTPTFRITKRPVTITAQPQTVTFGTAIDQGVEKIVIEGLVTGHTMTDITLTPSTDQVTANGSITPSAAAINDVLGKNVTANYEITYQDGLLVVLAKEVETEDNTKVIVEYDEEGNPQGHVSDVEDTPNVVIPETVIGPNGEVIPVTAIDKEAVVGKENIEDLVLNSEKEITFKDPEIIDWIIEERVKVHVYQTLLKSYAEGQLKDLVDAGLLVTDITNVHRMFTFSNAFDVILPNGVRQYTCQVINDQVHLHEIESRIVRRETGVLLIGTPKLQSYVATRETTPAGLYAGNDLRPVMESEHISEVSHAYLLKENAFHKMNLNNSIPDGKAYLLWPDPATYDSASARLLIVETETDIDAASAEDEDERWYDLQGRSLDKKPLEPGVYIRNGKKVIVK